MNKKKRLITISCSILICVITVLTWVYSNSTSNAIIAKTEIIPMLNHNKIEIHYSIENNTKNDNKIKYNHATILTKVSSKDIFYTAHTAPRKNQSLLEMIEKSKIFACYFIIIKDGAK